MHSLTAAGAVGAGRISMSPKPVIGLVALSGLSSGVDFGNRFVYIVLGHAF